MKMHQPQQAFSSREFLLLHQEGVHANSLIDRRKECLQKTSIKRLGKTRPNLAATPGQLSLRSELVAEKDVRSDDGRRSFSLDLWLAFRSQRGMVLLEGAFAAPFCFAVDV